MSAIDPIVRAILGEAAIEKETRTYTIRSRPDHLDKLEQLFSWINMTRSGHSGAASLSVDGDGSARVTIEKEGGELEPYDAEKVKDSQRIEYSIGLD